MSESPLPDDLSRWPQNPYQLLGISFNSPPRDVRRAYTRLIRTFKPEVFPEHFRRIREAYESVLPRAEEFAAREDPPPEQPAPVVRQSRLPADGLILPHRPPSWALEEELADLWQQAVAGADATAYGRLVRLQAQHPGSAAVYLRLYWLLTVAARLDTGRCANDWLVQGLLTAGAPGPLHQLYRDVVADDPAEAWSERYTRLLAADMRPAQLADLVEWRWRAGAWLERWDLLAADLRDLRPHICPNQEDAWLRLLFVLADEVAWHRGAAAEELMDACLNEIRQHEHLALRHREAFDRLDFLLGVARGWRKLKRWRTLPPVFLGLIVRSWTRPFAVVRPQLESVLERINRSPRAWLDHLTLVQRVASPVLAQFSRLLDDLEAAGGGAALDAATPAEAEDAVTELLVRLRLRTRTYRLVRLRLLEFCLREAITPERVAEVARNPVVGWTCEAVPLHRAVTIDWPLRCVYRAYRLFWV